MYKVELKIDKKDFMDCNIFYLKKYFGMKEIILISLLMVAGALLQVFFDTSLMLIMGIIALILVLGSMLFFIITSSQTFKFEFVRRGTTKQELVFLEDRFEIETFEKEKTFKDMFMYEKIDRVAIKKDVVYIYATIALNYYIKRDSFTEGRFDDFCMFLREKIPPLAFKMKQKKRRKKPDYLNSGGSK